jgi:3-hydroxyisobutyrate dehydrogenase-like beta-hydroxyacid dehydrogenase
MADDSSRRQIGFIGLGRMGRGLALNLCRKGFALRVHDISASRR